MKIRLALFAVFLIVSIGTIQASSQQSVTEEASKQATIATLEMFGPEGQIIETSEYDGIFRAEVLIKGGYEGDETVITYFEIVNGYVKAHNLTVEGQLYQYDDIVGAILWENIFSCYDCIEGPGIRTSGDCSGYLAFVTELDAPPTLLNFGELECPGTDSVTFEAVWIAALGEEIDNEGSSSGGGNPLIGFIAIIAIIVVAVIVIKRRS